MKSNIGTSFASPAAAEGQHAALRSLNHILGTMCQGLRRWRGLGCTRGVQGLYLGCLMLVIKDTSTTHPWQMSASAQVSTRSSVIQGKASAYSLQPKECMII